MQPVPNRRLSGLLSILAACLVPIESARGQFVEPDVRVHFEVSGDGRFGWAISELADIDGDGAMELIVGAPFVNGVVGAGDGRCVVYSGANGDVLMDLSADGPGENFGWSVADAGDANGDGVSDVLVGAPRRDAQRGAVYVFSGHPDSRGALLQRVDGQRAGESFGYALAGLGDVDGDGTGEVAIGAPQSDSGAGVLNDGRVYVVSVMDASVLHDIPGPVAGAQLGRGIGRIGDIDGDGATDFAASATNAQRAEVFSGATGEPLLVPLLPDTTAGAFGDFFVGPAGDANADGIPDIYVGDYAADGNRGRVHVYSGANGSPLWQRGGGVDGIGRGLGCGRSAGDVNGDGHDDIVAGSYLAGQATVFSGADGSTLRSISATSPAGQLGFDSVGIGDVTGDGLADLAISAAVGDTVYAIAGNCDADLDGDGQATIFDFLAFQNAFDAGDPIADFDGDGDLTIFDFLAFQNAFDICADG
ncbi:MAG: FG-GAP-like repeat-containing protein [Phycisphaera sp.]|nr:MAG: FG-GAP-like repeat-containing protein [Phycisphaera sp.]